MSAAPHLARGGGDRSLDMGIRIRDIITIISFTQLAAPQLARGGGDMSLDIVMKSRDIITPSVLGCVPSAFDQFVQYIALNIFGMKCNTLGLELA